MKRVRKQYYIVPAVIIAFTVGMGVGMLTRSEKVETGEEKQAIEETEIIQRTNTLPEEEIKREAEEIKYILVSEENRLKLFEEENGEERLIKSFSINSEVLPRSDREKLKRGIAFESEEDAYAAAENYSS